MADEMSSNDQDKITIAREYFIRTDQGRPDILELFHEDAEIYFPKFGFGFGRQSFFAMVKGFEGSLEHIRHDYDVFTFIASGDYLVVEGTSQGKMSDKSWAGGKTPGGRFCNVFKFRDGGVVSQFENRECLASEEYSPPRRGGEAARSMKKPRSHLFPRRRARSASAVARSCNSGQFGAIFSRRRSDHPVRSVKGGFAVFY